MRLGMVRRILVPVDGSPLGEAALPVAQALAGPLGAELILLRVVEPVTAVEAIATAGVVAPDAFFLRELDAKEYLHGICDRVLRNGLRARSELRKGQPAEEILAAAAETQADLIAMSSHGRSGLGRVLFGSVAHAVLARAPVPVLVVRATQPMEAPHGR
jgi:nucleotide-binding universal stress UspA family protein